MDVNQDKLRLRDYIEMDIDRISKDIRDRMDKELALEFTRVILKLLKENGVFVETEEVTSNYYNKEQKSIEFNYGVSITGIDFTEHDKPFKNEICKLKGALKGLIE